MTSNGDLGSRLLPSCFGSTTLMELKPCLSMLFCHFIPQIEGHDEIKAFIIVLDPKTISESVTMFALGMSAKAIGVKDKKNICWLFSILNFKFSIEEIVEK